MCINAIKSNKGVKMKQICSKCHDEYDSMFMPWEYVNQVAGTETTKRFMCPNCRCVLFIE